MIIPIGHDQQIRRLPWVTIAIIAACTLVQLYAQFGAPGIDDVVRTLDARHYANAADAEQQALALLDKIPIWRLGYHTDAGMGLGLITSAFVHAGWFHLIGNMIFLWLAGSVVEDRWGRAKYLAFYIAGAVAANLAFKAMYHGDGTILVGASGAISAALGAFLVFYGGTEIRFWYWLYMRTGTFQLAAYFALPLWLGEQILFAYLGHANPALSGVAYMAHIGGFAFGLGIALLSNMIFGRREHDAEDPHDNPIIPPATAVTVAADPARYDRCLEAIKQRDLGAVRTLASRAVLDLARTSEHARILTLYDAMAANLASIPLTDGAFAAAALAADATGDPTRYVAIATAFDRAHPGSSQLPKVLWRLAQHHRDAQRVDEAVAVLEQLEQRFSHDPFGIQARAALASRRGSLGPRILE